MQEIEKKYFADVQGGRLNADDADFVVGINEWVNCENARTGSTDKGVTGVWEGIGGTRQISSPQPSVTFVEIGSVEDKENGRILYFKKNTTGPWDKIVAYYGREDVEYDVLLSSQVTGGLNFSKDSIIHSAQIVDGMLYWPDNRQNQPRKINIDSAIKSNNPSFSTSARAYTFPINFSEITIIKPPPPLAPNILKDEDVGFENNFISNNSFMFAFQYIWYDRETTVLGTYSPASRLNKSGQADNYIQVTMDSNESIPDTVRMVRLIVRYGNGNDAFVVKVWDKANSDEAQEISDQNDGTAVLSFDFYNNVVGQKIASLPINLVLKPFDSVPLYSESLSVFRNRIGLSHNTEGYDTPLTTSMTLAQTSVNIGGAFLNKNLIEVRLRWGFPIPFGKVYSAYYVFFTASEVSPQGYYELTSTVQSGNGPTIPTLPAAPASFAFSGMNFRGGTQSEVVEYVKTSIGAQFNTNTNSFITSANIVQVTGISVTTYDIFKTASQYRAGMVFFDFAMRKCGVVTNDGLIFEIDSRNFAFSSGVNSVVWSLSNANALNEIPDWAYYYAPVRTLNLRTRSFIQSFTNAAKYATKDANGNYVYSSNTFVTGSVGIALNTTALVQSGLGYVFTQGDVAILTDNSNNTYELPVIAQDGNYIVVKAEDIGDLSAIQLVFEIYTPYTPSLQEPFFEMGQLYRILNPGTADRQYETLSDIFLPDSYVLTRNYASTTYFAEGMSPNDLFFQIWYNDGGKINFETKLGQVVKTNSISYSNTFVPNTAINGLSTFDAQDEKNLPIECGTIRKLQITSKVQDEIGIVLLAICEKETVSIYVGEIQLLGSGGDADLATTEQVLGTINVLKGSYGTLNPEAVTEYRGKVFFPSAQSGKWIQYSSNGLFPISDYKTVTFWNQWFKQYLSMTSAEIEVLGSRPFIFTTVDPHHEELLITIPKLLAQPPSGYLPDYPSTVYPFNIYDGQAKTIVYKLDAGIGNPHWQGAYRFTPEGFATLDDRTFAFKNGINYELNNTAAYCNFFGVQEKPRIMFVSNQNPSVPKSYNNISVEANIQPSFVYFYSAYPYQQASDLVDFDPNWNNLEGVYYATMYRNKLQPTATGFNTDGLLTGEKMRTTALKIMLEFSITTTNVQLKFVNIGYALSLGHKV